MTDPRFAPGSGRTGRFERVHRRRTPLTPQELAQAREAEDRRKGFDPHYITADEARRLTPDEKARRDVQERVAYSQPDWPENRMSATVALGELKGGGGESVELRPTEAASLFDGRKVGE